MREASISRTNFALSSELAELGVLRSYGDPYEQAFVEAMARRHQRQGEGMSTADVKARNEEADATLERLFSKGDGAL